MNHTRIFEIPETSSYFLDSSIVTSSQKLQNDSMPVQDQYQYRSIRRSTISFLRQRAQSSEIGALSTATGVSIADNVNLKSTV